MLDRHGRVLLFRGGDPARPEAGTWWFTPGGGAEAGETYTQAAVREVAEEAALHVGDRLTGPVWEREGGFDFDGVRVEQHEQFFVAALDVDGDTVAPDRTHWTELERRSVEGQRWWTRSDLAATTDTVFPPGLAGLLDVWLAELS